MRLAWDAAMAFRADVFYILRDFCCFVDRRASCFPTLSRARPSSPRPSAATSTSSMGHGQPDGPARLDPAWPARTAGLSIHRSHRPPAAFPVGHAAGRNDRQAQPPRPVIQTQGTNAPEPIASTPLSNSHRTIRKGAPSMKPHRLHPYPRAPTTPGASAPGPAHAETPTPRN